MASNPDHSSDDTSSSLGDSTYEILGDSTFFTSEDEDHEDNTDSVASTDQHAPDDVASLTDTESSDQTQDLETTINGADSHSQITCGFDGQHTGYGDQDSSAMTTKDHGHGLTQSIEFQEPRFGPGAEQVDVIHTVCTFNQEEASKISQKILGRKTSTQLIATIRQAMTRQGLLLDRPFRILFVGDSSAKTIIVEKVGAALAVPVAGRLASYATRGQSSRFNVVPISSFGDRASPEVELIDSSGLEIVVDHCTFAKSTTDKSNHEMISLTLNDNDHYQSRWGESGYHLDISPNWQLPDIAIILWSDEDDVTARQTRQSARLFMNRHAVPCIVISGTPLWTRSSDAINLDIKSPHLCVESRGSNGSDNRVLKRLPIDLSSFKNIDAGQLNRNLACLTGLHTGRENLWSTKRERLPAIPSPVSLPEDIEKAPLTTSALADRVNLFRRSTRPEIRTILLGGAALLCTIAYILARVGYAEFTQIAPPWPEPPIQTTVPLSAIPTISSSSSRPLALASSNTIIARSTASVPNTGSVMNTLSIRGTNRDLTSLLQDSTVTTLNHSDQFKVQIIGDCHIILRPPYLYTLMKRPKISVMVSRNKKTVEHELSKVFDGVYAVKLRREEAYGVMHVSVWIKSKPIFNQTYAVDFGTPWLKALGWGKMPDAMSEQLKKEYNTTLDWLRIGYSRIFKEMQALTEIATSRAAVYQKKAEKTGRVTLRHASNIKDTAASTMTRIPEFVSKYSAVSSKLLIKRSIRTSKSLSSMCRRTNKHLAHRASEVATVGTRHLTTLCRAATGVDIAKLWEEVSEMRVIQPKRSLRAAQKSAVRFWKKLSRAKGRKVAPSSASLNGRKAKVDTRRNR